MLSLSGLCRYLIQRRLILADIFAWLIEAPGQNYLSYRHLGRHEFHWTKDHTRALRFFSLEQADNVMMAIRELAPTLFAFAITLGEAKPVEHGWISEIPIPPEPTTADAGGEG